MSNIDAFAGMVIDEIKARTSDDFNFKYANYAIQEITKFDNVKYTGLVIQFPGETASPIFPLNDYFTDMLVGENSIEKIASSIIQSRRILSNPDFPAFKTMLTSYEKIKSNLAIRLTDETCSESINPDFVRLEQGDFTATYCAAYQEEGKDYCMPITKMMLEFFDIDPIKLHQDALSNMKDKGFELTTIMDQIMYMGGPEVNNYIKADGSISPTILDQEELPVFVLSNTDKRYGASAILQQDLMDKITETIGDVYIIPSSTDEVLVFPVHYNGEPGMDPQMLQDMLVQVNDTDNVPPDKFLSNRLFAYEKSGTAPILASSYIQKQHGMELQAETLPAPKL